MLGVQLRGDQVTVSSGHVFLSSAACGRHIGRWHWPVCDGLMDEVTTRPKASWRPLDALPSLQGQSAVPARRTGEMVGSS